MRENRKGNVLLYIVILLTIIAVASVFFGKSIRKNREQYGLSPTSVVQTTPENGNEAIPEGDIAEGLSLILTAPAGKSTVSQSRITVSGKTSPNADIFINDAELKADANGNFLTGINLEEGENTIVITASDAEGNYAEKSITVNYEPTE